VLTATHVDFDQYLTVFIMQIMYVCSVIHRAAIFT